MLKFLVVVSSKQGMETRVGKKRHDEGYAADVWIYSGGQRLSTARPHPVVSKFIASCVSNGARGIGAGETDIWMV